jgi:putative hydrolase of the HAD superfamily
MEIRAILFDVNGTLIDILTDEGMLEIYRKVRHFLSYQGILIPRSTELRDQYFQILKGQKERSHEKYPEFDAVAIWRTILENKQTTFTRNLDPHILHNLPLMLAQLYRSASLCRSLQLYPDVTAVLDRLVGKYRMGIVTNAQSAYALPELNAVNLVHYFEVIIISGDFGFCKPDVRLFDKALHALKIDPKQTLYVGNDMFHDIVGGKKAGMRTIFFDSNQGDKRFSGAEPDYIIRNFGEIMQALEFFKNNSSC